MFTVLLQKRTANGWLSFGAIPYGKVVGFHGESDKAATLILQNSHHNVKRAAANSKPLQPRFYYAPSNKIAMKQIIVLMSALIITLSGISQATPKGLQKGEKAPFIYFYRSGWQRRKSANDIEVRPTRIGVLPRGMVPVLQQAACTVAGFCVFYYSERRHTHRYLSGNGRQRKKDDPKNRRCLSCIVR